MISRNSERSASEYLIVGPVCSYIGFESNTDFVNSGSYFTELLVVVFGITTLEGLGGSFLITCFTEGFIDTNDLGSLLFGFLGATKGAGFSAGLATTAGFAATGAGLVTCFCGTTLAAGFFGATFFGAGFLAGADFFTVFFVTAVFLEAAFGAGLVAFLAACFFLLAMI